MKKPRTTAQAKADEYARERWKLYRLKGQLAGMRKNMLGLSPYAMRDDGISVTGIVISHLNAIDRLVNRHLLTLKHEQEFGEPFDPNYVELTISTGKGKK
jgi:hypothetical protein